jgi:hypothetical protein
MAYTSSPTNDTYSSENIDLIREVATRAGNVTNKDEDYLNVFIEDTLNRMARDNRMFVMKRAGSTAAIANIASGTIRGSIYWADPQKLYYAIGSNIYIYNFSLGTSTTLTPGGTWTSSGTVGFAEFIFNDGTTAMIVSDGTNLIQISPSNAITFCTSANLPVPHDPNIIYIDGYILAAKNATGDIYNSDNNSPLTWTTGNFLNAEVEADYVTRILKVNNYVVACGTETMEYFWDAAIATGSPFQRNDTPIKRITYIGAYAKEQNNSYFVGKDLNGEYQVFKLYEFKCDPVSTPTISRYLNSLGTDYHNWLGAVIAFQGHQFYMLNAGSVTYVMDLKTGLWTKMAYQGNTNFNIAIAHAVQTSTTNRTMFALNDGTSNWYQFDETLYQDNGLNFNCVVVTEASDFGTMNRKNMSRLTVVGDRPPINSNIVIQWTDDDYQTYNAGISANLNQDICCIYQLGNFRQRCFKLTHSDNTLFRIQKLVANINKGQS